MKKDDAAHTSRRQPRRRNKHDQSGGAGRGVSERVGPTSGPNGGKGSGAEGAHGTRGNREAREFHLEHVRAYNTSSPLRWILSHSFQYWWLPTALVVTAVANNFAYGNVPLFIGRGFDIIQQPGWQRRDLLVVAGIVALSAVIQGITGLLRNAATEFLAQRVERDSREELYTSLLGKSQSFHAAQRIGDVMARATNDVRSLNLMFSPGLMLIIDSSLALLVPFGMILFIDVRLGLVPAIFTLLLIVTVWDYNRRLEPVSLAQREEFGAMNSTLAEAIGGIEVVKGNVQERYEIDKFTGRAKAFRDYFVKQGEVQARYWPMLAFAVSWGLALLHSLLLWRAGTVSLGQVVSFMGLFGTFRFATFISIFSFNLVQLGIASAGRILALIRQETLLDRNAGGRRDTMRGKIELRHVWFSFGDTSERDRSTADGVAASRTGAHHKTVEPHAEGPPGEVPDAPRPVTAVADGATAAVHGRPTHADERRGTAEPSGFVLKDVSVTIEPGETVAIVGQTGSGKTTLVRLVNRIFDVSRGAVLVDDVDVREWDLERLRSQISTIEQDVFLYSMSIRENIAFGRPDADAEAVEQAARRAQADGFIRSFRDGYDTEIGERGVTLSGGQKQRLAIARAFLTDPRILILDDSTSAIDSRTEDEIQRAMRTVASGRTTLIITHRLSQIRHADRVLLIKRGRVLDVGRHEELLERSEDYRRIFAHV